MKLSNYLNVDSIGTCFVYEMSLCKKEPNPMSDFVADKQGPESHNERIPQVQVVYNVDCFHT